jgi:hypothetical protein
MKGGKMGRPRRGIAKKEAPRGAAKKAGSKHPNAGAPKKGERRIKDHGWRSSSEEGE